MKSLRGRLKFKTCGTFMKPINCPPWDQRPSGPLQQGIQHDDSIYIYTSIMDMYIQQSTVNTYIIYTTRSIIFCHHHPFVLSTTWIWPRPTWHLNLNRLSLRVLHSSSWLEMTRRSIVRIRSWKIHRAHYSHLLHCGSKPLVRIIINSSCRPTIERERERWVNQNVNTIS